jgi:hypothetical protein
LLPKRRGYGAKDKNASLATPKGSQSFKLIELRTGHTLFVGLDMADLAAVRTFARRPCRFLGSRFGRVGSLLAHGCGAAIALLQHLLLLLALVAALFVLLEALSFFFDTGGESVK